MRKGNLEALLSYAILLFSYFSLLKEAFVSEASWIALLLAQTTINSISIIFARSSTKDEVFFAIVQFSFLTQLVTLVAGLYSPLEKFLLLAKFLFFYDLISISTLAIEIVERPKSNLLRSFLIGFIAGAGTWLYFYLR
ncbi:hypothetical protein IPA_01515 [Ignicoccus pacificus DSM 13166]|uniref:Uncharacterized protein n=1 Tax=Ignicoccus pacificus DSM 13166 TaxID=940294 RepID=A0A977KAM0_9CREN|nr:hypothetical protein IPA_01515 [Ignicoccus pacificus DSM 13166]